MQELHSVRLGCVKYLNARPLVHGWPGQVTFDHPAALCAQLARGELDVALVSSFEFLRNPVYHIVDGISISSDGPVYSVFVAHRGELSQIEEIALDPASLTSIALLRSLLPEFGLTPRLLTNNEFESVARQNVLGSAGCQSAVAGSLPATSAASPTALRKMSRQAAETNRLAACAPQNLRASRGARLLIGDQAIRFRQEHGQDFKFWDLGEAWKKTTGLPFVFALWLVRPEVPDAETTARKLRELRDTNLHNVDQLIAEEREFAPDFCRRYLYDHLQFDFGEQEKKGLQTFGALCAQRGLIPKRELALNLV